MFYPIEEEVLHAMVTDKQRTVADLSTEGPVMLVFLRHFGCTFCREALSDLSEQRSSIERMGTRLILVHMAADEIAERYFQRYGLADIDHVRDEQCEYYAAFRLTKGNFNQLFGLQNWIRGFDAALLRGHGVGTGPIGDGFQMPGVFIIQNKVVQEHFVHKSSSSRPNYIELLQNCCGVPDSPSNDEMYSFRPDLGRLADS